MRRRTRVVGGMLLLASILFISQVLAIDSGKGGVTEGKGTRILPDPEPVEVNDPAEQVGAAQFQPVKRKGTSSTGASIPPGTYTVGAGGTYATLSDAVSALQTDGVAGGGTVYFELIDNSYVETGLTIGGYPGQGTSAPVVFRPAPGIVAKVLFSHGSVTVNAFGILFWDAIGVTIDGSNSGGTDRSLTLECDTNETFDRNGIVIQRGSSHITVKNVIVLANRRAASNGYQVIRIYNQDTGLPDPGPQHDITIDNCWIYRGLTGIYTRALNQYTRDYNFVFTGNLLGGAGSASVLDNLNANALIIEGVDNVRFAGNDVYGIQTYNSTIYAIRLVGGNTNVLVEDNKIHNLRTMASAGAFYAFYIANNAATSYSTITTQGRFIDNAVYDVASSTSSSTGGRGIIYSYTGPPSTLNGAGSNMEFIYNTFHLDLGSAAKSIYAVTAGSAGRLDAGYSDVLTFTNNLFYTSSNGLALAYLFNSAYTPASNVLQVYSDHNLLYSSSAAAGGSWSYTPVPWPDGTPAYVDFETWRLESGNDIHSADGDVIFQAADDWKVSEALGDLSAANAIGIPIPSKSVDLEGEARDPLTPDAGADEFDNTPATNDAGAVGISQPSSIYVPANNPAWASVRIRNYSINSLDVPIRLQVFDPVGIMIYNEQYVAAGVPALSLATIAMPVPVPVGGAGIYNVSAVTEVPGDQRPLNDGPVHATFEAQTVVSALNYAMDWESGPGGWSGTGDFVLGSFSKLGGPHSGANAWVTQLVGNYSNVTHSQLISPWFDLSLISKPRISFWSSIATEASWDGGILEYTSDGISWYQLGVLNDPLGMNWYNIDVYTNASGDPICFDEANRNLVLPAFPVGPKWTSNGDCGPGTPTGPFAWIQHVRFIPELAGVPAVRFRYRTMQDALTTFEGFALDDFQISEVRNMVFAGINPAATDGVDAFDIAAPPPPPQDYEYAYFHLAPGEPIQNFLGDIRQDEPSLLTRAKQWDLETITDHVSASITIEFVLSGLPAEYGAVLYDLTLDTYTNIRWNTVFTYISPPTESVYPFKLLMGDVTNPSISVNSPNGSEFLVVGSPTTITWTGSDASGVLQYDLYYTLTGSPPYTLLTSLPGTATSYVWTPDAPSAMAAVKIVARDSVLNEAFDVSDASFTILPTNEILLNAWAGWNLVSVPVLQADMSTSGIFGDDYGLTPYFVFQYAPAIGYTTTTSLLMGHGYWLGSNAAQLVDAVGTPVNSATLPLAQGFNIIGNPFAVPLPSGSLLFTDGLTTKTRDEAVLAGWISSVLFGYNGASYYVATGDLGVWQGYWIPALLSGISVVYTPAVIVPTPAAIPVKSSPEGWTVELGASLATMSGVVEDHIAAFGVQEHATRGYDGMVDAPRPPRSPSGEYVEIAFAKPDESPAWMGNGFARVMTEAAGMSWTFEVRSSSAGTVTLTWDNELLKVLRADVKVILHDVSAANRVDMKQKRSYTFEETGTTRLFRINQGEAARPVMFRLEQNHPNPFNPSTVIAFALPFDAQVRIDVYDNLGRQMATVVDGQKEAGYHEARFDGSSLSSGLYFYRMTAVDLSGHRHSDMKKMMLVK